MNIQLVKTLVGCLFLAILQSVHADDRADIEKLINGLHDDAANARYEDYFNRYSPDAFFLGTDSTERWSIPEFKQYAKPAFDRGGWSYTVVERNLRIRANVAWFDEQLDNDHLGRCRGTGVVVREAGHWEIEHYSLTLLIPNAIADDVAILANTSRSQAKKKRDP
jgi:hypothetical protein